MESASAPVMVWAGGRVAIYSCPTSYVTSESIALLEEVYAFKLLGAGSVYELPARLVEAIFVLEKELRTESSDGQK